MLYQSLVAPTDRWWPRYDKIAILSTSPILKPLCWIKKLPITGYSYRRLHFSQPYYLQSMLLQKTSFYLTRLSDHLICHCHCLAHLLCYSLPAKAHSVFGLIKYSSPATFISFLRCFHVFSKSLLGFQPHTPQESAPRIFVYEMSERGTPQRKTKVKHSRRNMQTR